MTQVGPLSSYRSLQPGFLSQLWSEVGMTMIEWPERRNVTAQKREERGPELRLVGSPSELDKTRRHPPPEADRKELSPADTLISAQHQASNRRNGEMTFVLF